MINNISWGSYWSVLSILVAIYYLCVLLVYYRKDLQRHFQTKNNIRQSPEPESGDESSPLVQSLTDELKAYLLQVSRKSLIREEILFGLQQLTKRYAILKNNPSRSSIEQLILTECENNCAINLSAEELKMLWVGAG